MALQCNRIDLGSSKADFLTRMMILGSKIANDNFFFPKDLKPILTTLPISCNNSWYIDWGSVQTLLYVLNTKN